MMNTPIAFLTVTILLIVKICAEPEDATQMDITTGETMPMETTTTTTTTTLPPEIDREWEDLVLAGPAVVNYLSLFMVSASRQDQALTPDGTYTIQYIQNVNSLHAILSQISSAMKAAFESAHDDLIRIQASMNQIPEHIKASLLLIQTAPDDLLSQLLPYTLRNVDRAANEGSTVSKLTLKRFTFVSLLLEELVILLNSTLTAAQSNYLIEANIYANDIKIQWNLLVKLFRKFSDRADTTQKGIDESFVAPIDEARKSNDLNSQSKRSAHLDELIPAAIFIHQSSHSLDIMVTTYMDITNDYNTNEVTSINRYLYLPLESERIEIQQKLWENIVLQSVKIARFAQERQNQFVITSRNRPEEYATYSQKALTP